MAWSCCRTTFVVTTTNKKNTIGFESESKREWVEWEQMKTRGERENVSPMRIVSVWLVTKTTAYGCVDIYCCWMNDDLNPNIATSLITIDNMVVYTISNWINEMKMNVVQMFQMIETYCSSATIVTTKSWTSECWSLLCSYFVVWVTGKWVR